jgi:hypothetical protein
LKFKFFVLFLVITIAGFSSSPLYADSTPITVQNASFENYNPFTNGCSGAGCAYNGGQIPNWSITGGAGSWQPGSNSVYFNTALPGGNTVAFVNFGSISQDLGISLLPNSVYTLSVFVGNRLDGMSGGTYSIGLDAGASLLGSTTGLNSSLTRGTFTQEFFTFSTGQTVTPGDLSIVLGTSGGQSDFDNVSLAVGQNTSVPEPTSLVLLIAGAAFVGLFSLLRRA